MSTLPHSFSGQVPEGDNRTRDVCDHCGFVAYENPKIVVGGVCLWEEKILLCRRSIEPRVGFWTLPAGFMEQGESCEEGLCREAEEEACASLEVETLLGIYSIPRISQVQLIYRARLTSPDVEAGEESLEVQLFDWAEIPWADLAFPSVHWALYHHRQVQEERVFAPFRRDLAGMDDVPPAT